MSTPPSQQSPHDSTDDFLKTQALVVTHGPFKGRICENDDDEFLFKSNFRSSELAWLAKAGIEWRTLEIDEDDNEFGAPDASDSNLGVDCGVITFGFYLDCCGYYYIPRQFLRLATTHDLIQRHQEINEIVSSDAWTQKRRKSKDTIIELLKEENYIVNEIWRREKSLQDTKEPRNVFLCHSSADKPFVRQVHSDLANMGHTPWLDELRSKLVILLFRKLTKERKVRARSFCFFPKRP